MNNMTKHSFSIDIAEQLGIEEAIIYDNICFWVEKNRANDKHFYDGRYWTYNSVKAFEELFPYMTKHVINRALKKLEEHGYIVTGNYNKSTYDRTKWYSCNQQIHLLKNGNGFVENRNTIPDSNTYDNTYSKTDNSFKQKTKNSISSNSSSSNNTLKNQNEKKKKNVAPKKTKRFGKAEFRKVLIENYKCDVQHVDDWLEVRDKHKAAYTKTSLRAIVNECIKNDYPVKKAIEACASNSWRGFKYAWIENLNNSNKPKFNKPNNDFIINR